MNCSQAVGKLFGSSEIGSDGAKHSFTTDIRSFHLSAALIYQPQMTQINQEKNPRYPRHPRLKDEIEF